MFSSRLALGIALLALVSAACAVPVDDAWNTRSETGDSKDASLADLVTDEAQRATAPDNKPAEEDNDQEMMLKEVDAHGDDESFGGENAHVAKARSETMLSTGAQIKSKESGAQLNQEAVAVQHAIKKSIMNDVQMHDTLEQDMKHLQQDIAMSQDLRNMEAKFQAKAAKYGVNMQQAQPQQQTQLVSEGTTVSSKVETSACLASMKACREQAQCKNGSCEFEQLFKECTEKAALNECAEQ